MTKTIKLHLFGVLTAPIRRTAVAFTTAALLALIATPAFAGKGGTKGKPGGGDSGGGEEPPPPTPAPVEYELTWIPGINDGYIRIYDCNSAGIAVGTYADETGTSKYKPFCTTADGVIRPLDDWWTLPPGYEGWRVGTREGVVGGEIQINEANLVCGSIVNDLTSEHQLFLANLSDPDSLEPVGSVVSDTPRYLYMNEPGDVAFSVSSGFGIRTLYLYVRSLDKMFAYDQDIRGYYPTGINDNLQVSLVFSEFIWGNDPTVINNHGSGILTFTYDEENDEGVFDIDDLGTAWTIWEPMTLPWGGINNAGEVFGCFETEDPRIRVHRNQLVHRSADTTAGFIAAGAETWTELDARLPIGGSVSPNSYGAIYTAAACALGVNEFGQVVGGYNKSSGRYGAENLWLLDRDDGLFDVNDLVVGDLAEVEAFWAADNIGLVHITEPHSETGYGIISGASSASFILTPRLVEQP